MSVSMFRAVAAKSAQKYGFTNRAISEGMDVAQFGTFPVLTRPNQFTFFPLSNT